MYKYNNLILGGTFDHFHQGHKKLIDQAFNLAKNVTIGVTTKNLIIKKFLSETIESYQTREKTVRNYLITNNYLSRSKIIPINDIYGTTKTEKNIEALICSSATYKNALRVNGLRKKLGFSSLKIIITPYVLGDNGKTITSELIRSGEINREGHSFFKIFSNKQSLILPEGLREELRKPFGNVLSISNILKNISKAKAPAVITVGDITTMALLNKKFNPDVKIIDFRSRRKNIDRTWNLEHRILLNKAIKRINQPGMISKTAVLAFKRALKIFLNQGIKQTIIISGEEDLLTLPVVLLAPLGSIVLYGQMDLGIILIEVTEEKKKQAEKLLKKFI